MPLKPRRKEVAVEERISTVRWIMETAFRCGVAESRPRSCDSAHADAIRCCRNGCVAGPCLIALFQCRARGHRLALQGRTQPGVSDANRATDDDNRDPDGARPCVCV